MEKKIEKRACKECKCFRGQERNTNKRRVKREVVVVVVVVVGCGRGACCISSWLRYAVPPPGMLWEGAWWVVGSARREEGALYTWQGLVETRGAHRPRAEHLGHQKAQKAQKAQGTKGAFFGHARVGGAILLWVRTCYYRIR